MIATERLIIHGIDHSLVRPEQLATELHVVRRIGENKIDRLFRHAVHYVDAVAFDDLIAESVIEHSVL